MKRYLATFVFTLIVVVLYQYIDIRLFSFDLTKITKEALFRLRNEPEPDTTIILLNIGKLEPSEIKIRIDTVLKRNPKVIGINLCHYDKMSTDLMSYYASSNKVVFANCKDNMSGSLSQIITEGNRVTHFKTDRADYFELKLTHFEGTGNSEERINYARLHVPFYVSEIDDVEWSLPDALEGKTLLVGYMGDYLLDSIHYYKNTRITPLNYYYDQDGILPDMYDIVISANILRTINHNDYIKETNQLARILILLAFSFITVTILTFGKTKWIIANLLIAIILFIFLNGIGSLTIVYFFDSGYFLEIDELPILLFIVTAFTLFSNMNENRIKAPIIEDK